MIDRERKDSREDAQEIKEILNVVSTEIPAMIKSILGSVFSEEAGRNMGKAAAAYYKELKNSGMPDEVAVKLTEDYMGTFTSLGDMLKGIGRGSHSRSGVDIAEEVRDEVRDAIDRKRREREERDDE